MSTFAEIFYKMFEESQSYDEACAEIELEREEMKKKEKENEQ